MGTEAKQAAGKLTFGRALELLGQAAEQIAQAEPAAAEAAIRKGLALASVTNAGMKVVATAVAVAGLREQPRVLQELLGPKEGLVIEDEAVEMETRRRSELAVVARELERADLTPGRRAFLEGKRKQLEK